MKHFAILVIGTGKNRRYAIVEVISGCGYNPTSRINYKTIEAAQAAANSMGINISVIGDAYQVIKGE